MNENCELITTLTKNTNEDTIINEERTNPMSDVSSILQINNDINT